MSASCWTAAVPNNRLKLSVSAKEIRRLRGLNGKLFVIRKLVEIGRRLPSVVQVGMLEASVESTRAISVEFEGSWQRSLNCPRDDILNTAISDELSAVFLKELKHYNRLMGEALTALENSIEVLNGVVTMKPVFTSSCIVPTKHPSPPVAACFLLDLLLSRADRQVVPGDLLEEFTTSILPKYGAKRAHIWFWKQTICTLAWRNPICRWLLMSGLVRAITWIFRQIVS
jgi:hypothetical protein